MFLRSLSATLLAASFLATPGSAITNESPAACMVSNVDETSDPIGDSGVNSGTCCVTSTQYSLTSKNTTIPYGGIPTFIDGPGGKVTVERSYTGPAQAQVTAGAESEVGAVLAKAKVNVSASLTLSTSNTTTHRYEQDIAPGKLGHLQYVNYGKQVSYRKYRLNYNCTTTTLATGTIKYPAAGEGWKYWETTP